MAVTVYKEKTAAAKSLQLCPTMCDPIDGSPLCSPVPAILQARILEWVAIAFSETENYRSPKSSDPQALARGFKKEKQEDF